jgi:diacylglycerol kinase (ATP)
LSRTLIVNPFASRVTEDRVRAVESRLMPEETLLTEHRGHATELAREASGEEVWVLGGDGVVNEVLNGLRPGVVLGIVPGGHTNVLARAIGRTPRRISLGRVNGRRFAFAAGIGVDSEAVRELDTVARARAGKRPGDLAYARVIAARLLRGYEPALELEGLGRAAIAFVSKDAVFTYAWRMPLSFSPAARFELGLDVAAPERIDRRALTRFVPRLAAARGLAGAKGVVSGHDLDRLVIRSGEPRPLQADGEDLGDVTEAVFEAERDALTVRVAS